MDAAPYSALGVSRTAGVRSAQAVDHRRPGSSGVVPQQPPMTETPSSVTNWRWYSASWSGVEVVVHGLPSTTEGSPALGRQETGMRGVAGQVAQRLEHLATARWRS